MTRNPKSWLAFIVVACAFLSGCVAPERGAPSQGAASRPALVVLIVVDGLPQWQVVDYREQLAPDGLRRFLDRGAWFADAHHGHGITVTAPGHAVLLTGATADRNGIIGNEWRDHATGQRVYCTGDAAHGYIGHKTEPLDGTSPKNLLVETLGDVLKRSDAQSKVIAISAKDRGAILPAGKTGTAYMYMGDTGEFASTTYYMKEHPAWVKAFHAKRPADAYFGKEWRPVLSDAAYGKSLPDGQKWYAKGGKLPKNVAEGLGTPSPAFYKALAATPFMDELTLDFARAAIAAESLGGDDSPDILVVSLSTHDYVNHAYSAESRLSHDHVLHLDRALQAFFSHLDSAVGKDRYVAVLTSDHGFMPAPEHSQSLGRNAGKQSGSQTVARLNKALATRFGEGNWVSAISVYGVLFNRKLIAQKGADLNALAEEARSLLLKEAGIEVAYTRAELESGSKAGAAHFDMLRRSWHRERSADVQYALKPYWMMTSSSSSATHGSPHPYDTHVPLLVYGPRWVQPGRRDGRVEMVDIAPTLAAMLRIGAPEASRGRPLPLGAR